MEDAEAALTFSLARAQAGFDRVEAVSRAVLGGVACPVTTRRQTPGDAIQSTWVTLVPVSRDDEDEGDGDGDGDDKDGDDDDDDDNDGSGKARDVCLVPRSKFWQSEAITLIARGMKLTRLCLHAPAAALLPLPARVGQG